ncbi:MAG: nitroreductase family protein [Candidatus Peribacteraceae bacterium]|nr:nitroreductase family protein [Candidatus Peribacteraceae bacterium]MDD5075303.1 nitroreductase family protein [Candidatus Peribacteraceae bacterium]
MVLPAILRRRAVREYRKDPISSEQIEEIIKAAQFAPTARNRRAVEFIVVTDRETRTALSNALLPQEFVKEAPVIIVPVVNTKAASKPVIDLALASQNIFLQATSMGLGSIWKHVHEGEELEKVRAILGIPENFLLTNIIPIGYAEVPPPPHTDAEYDAKKIHREKW